MRKSWFQFLSILILVVIVVGDFCMSSMADEAASARVYQRNRPRQGARNGYPGRSIAGNYGYRGFPYYPYYPPLVSGSWYARPYPYHFDYYRQLYSGAFAAPMAPTMDPCGEK